MTKYHPVDYANKILQSFNLTARCINFKQVRNISIFDLKLPPGAKVRELRAYSEELALALRSKTLPLFRLDPIQGIVKMELVNTDSSRLDLLPNFLKKKLPAGNLPFYLGNATTGKDIWLDLVKCPHMIVAGATCSGKSTFLHTLIANAVCFNNVMIHILDTKNVEYNNYSEVFPQIKTFTDYDTIYYYMEALIGEMEHRYDFIQRHPEKIEHIPYLLLVIDEFADLIMQDRNKAFYKYLCMLSQKCRAARIHIVLATQRPSVEILSGAIKSNYPTRIAFRTASSVDSRIILDANGAELLAGNGDGLIRSYEHSLVRFQSPFTTPEEIQNYVRKQKN